MIKKITKIVFLLSLIILNIIIIIIIPSFIQFKIENSNISYDSWIQFLGSIGGALLGGSIAAVGLYISFKENRAQLGVQITNEQIRDYKEFQEKIDIIKGEIEKFRDKIAKENLFKLPKTQDEDFDAYILSREKVEKFSNEFLTINKSFFKEIPIINDGYVYSAFIRISNRMMSIMVIYQEIFDHKKEKDIDENVKRYDLELSFLIGELDDMQNKLISKLQKLYAYKFNI